MMLFTKREIKERGFEGRMALNAFRKGSYPKAGGAHERILVWNGFNPGFALRINILVKGMTSASLVQAGATPNDQVACPP